MHSIPLAAGYITDFFSRHWEKRLQELEAPQTRSPMSVHVQKKRAVTYASTHSDADADTDADTFSDVNRNDASAAAFAMENSSPNNVDPHRRTDEQLARFGDLRFTISSSNAGFYICHTRLTSGTLMSIILQLSGFIILLDQFSGREPGT